jgi:hypothetical protein
LRHYEFSGRGENALCDARNFQSPASRIIFLPVELVGPLRDKIFAQKHLNEGRDGAYASLIEDEVMIGGVPASHDFNVVNIEGAMVPTP